MNYYFLLKLMYCMRGGAKERVGCGKQREATIPIESLLKLQPWFLSSWAARQVT